MITFSQQFSFYGHFNIELITTLYDKSLTLLLEELSNTFQLEDIGAIYIQNSVTTKIVKIDFLREDQVLYDYT